MFIKAIKSITESLPTLSNYKTYKKSRMNTKDRQGLFEAIDSFTIRRRNEFYIIGQLLEGTMEENWFINVSLNETLAITLRITSIEDVEISSEKNNYKLLIVSGDDSKIDFLLGMGIGSEHLYVTIDGQD